MGYRVKKLSTIQGCIGLKLYAICYKYPFICYHDYHKKASYCSLASAEKYRLYSSMVGVRTLKIKLNTTIKKLFNYSFIINHTYFIIDYTHFYDKKPVLNFFQN